MEEIDNFGRRFAGQMKVLGALLPLFHGLIPWAS
jgi:hypothetical protein